ncbi:head GIN domain-containing protein [Flavobacterium daejeonense]|uniref:head GIN domain-containing protein n=1 Tax=Flavobacterium daejeonense TaxID=350893 RepID=UPI00054DE24C|nr:head GIN domain-containing protein [Flavobacterium daejeonense]
MKTLQFKNYFLLFLTALAMGSCMHYEKNETVKYSGSISNESRHFDESFNKINVSNAITLIIEQSDNPEVRVITNKGFHDEINTKVKNGTLYVSGSSSKTSFSFFGYKSNFTKEASTKKVIVKIPNIEELEASSASTIESRGILKGNYISLKASSASKIDTNLEFDEINAEASSASKIHLKGLALHLETNTSSASKIEAEDLLANTIKAEASSGSKTSIHPIVSLKADASSGSKMEYNNTPKQIEKSASSGASISKK